MPGEFTEAPVQEVVEQQVEGQVEGEQGQSIEQKAQAATGVEEKIALFKEIAGGIPEGMDIIMHNGVPHLVGKVNGRQTYKSLDTIIRDYSMSEAAEEKLQQAKLQESKVKEQQRFVQEVVKTLINDPDKYWDMLRSVGIPDDKIYEISAKQLQRAVEEAKTPSEVREAKKLQLENEMLKKQIRDKEEREKEYQNNIEKEKQYAASKNEIYKALEENKIFDENVPEELRANITYSALYWMKAAEDQGVKDFTPDKAVKKAMRDLEKWGKTYYNSLSDDMLVKMLPDKVAKLYAQSLGRTATVTPTANSIFKTKSKTEDATPKKDKNVKSINDYFNKL